MKEGLLNRTFGFSQRFRMLVIFFYIDKTGRNVLKTIDLG